MGREVGRALPVALAQGAAKLLARDRVLRDAVRVLRETLLVRARDTNRLPQVRVDELLPSVFVVVVRVVAPLGVPEHAVLVGVRTLRQLDEVLVRLVRFALESFMEAPHDVHEMNSELDLALRVAF